MNNNNSGFSKLILVFLILYCLLPDPIPGPIDDILMIVGYYLYNNRVTRIEE